MVSATLSRVIAKYGKDAKPLKPLGKLYISIASPPPEIGAARHCGKPKYANLHRFVGFSIAPPGIGTALRYGNPEMSVSTGL